MKQFGFILLFLSVQAQLTAQKNTMDITGVYFMQGVMESASVFELKQDSSFQFFFSQGALDRYGKGTWAIKDGRVVFSSRHRPAKDFALVSSKQVPDDFITVRIAEKNSMILPYTDVSIKSGGKISGHSTDSHGEVRFPKQHIDSISLLFRLCPDRASSFAIDNKKHNYFEFGLEPWIAEVFFENFSLSINEKELNGQHPLLEGNAFRYVKEK
jgi:hypothetical protein